jgi:hypothetical protein
MTQKPGTTKAPQRMAPIATRVLYEDQELRIWDQVVEPGGILRPHKHENDYVLVDIKGESLSVDFLPGNEGEFDGHIDLPIRRGNALLIKKGGVETAKNDTDEAARYILVELLDDRVDGDG